MCVLSNLGTKCNIWLQSSASRAGSPELNVVLDSARVVSGVVRGNCSFLLRIAWGPHPNASPIPTCMSRIFGAKLLQALPVHQGRAYVWCFWLKSHSWLVLEGVYTGLCLTHQSLC